MASWHAGARDSTGKASGFSGNQAFHGYGSMHAPGKDMVSGPPSTKGEDNPWVAYLGLPVGGTVDRNPYDDHGVETLNFPQAYVGKNYYLSSVIITIITFAQTVPLRFLLPYTEDFPGLDIVWDEFIFDDAVLSVTPEQGVPRLVTSRVAHNGTSLIRHALGALMECAMMGTKMGDLLFRNHILQIANATTVTLCLSVIMVLLNPAYHNLPAVHRIHRFDDRGALEARIQMALNQWHCLAKGPSAMKIMLANNKRLMVARCGKPGNVWMVPAGTLDRIEWRPENWVPPQLDKMGPDFHKHYIELKNGLSMYESQAYPQGNGEPYIDPQFSPRRTGSFFTFTGQFTQHLEPEVFRTQMLDIEIYSERLDDFVRIPYATAIRYTGVFYPRRGGGGGRRPGGVDDGKGDAKDDEVVPGGLTHIGAAVFRGMGSWGDWLEDAEDNNRLLTQWLTFITSASRAEARVAFASKFVTDATVDRLPSFKPAQLDRSWLRNVVPSGPGSGSGSGGGGGGGGGSPPPDDEKKRRTEFLRLFDSLVVYSKRNDATYTASLATMALTVMCRGIEALNAKASVSALADVVGVISQVAVAEVAKGDWNECLGLLVILQDALLKWHRESRSTASLYLDAAQTAGSAIFDIAAIGTSHMMVYPRTDIAKHIVYTPTSRMLPLRWHVTSEPPPSTAAGVMTGGVTVTFDHIAMALWVVAYKMQMEAVGRHVVPHGWDEALDILYNPAAIGVIQVHLLDHSQYAVHRVCVEYVRRMKVDGTGSIFDAVARISSKQPDWSSGPSDVSAMSAEKQAYANLITTGIMGDMQPAMTKYTKSLRKKLVAETQPVVGGRVRVAERRERERKGGAGMIGADLNSSEILSSYKPLFDMLVPLRTGQEEALVGLMARRCLRDSTLTTGEFLLCTLAVQAGYQYLMGGAIKGAIAWITEIAATLVVSQLYAENGATSGLTKAILDGVRAGGATDRPETWLPAAQFVQVAAAHTLLDLYLQVREARVARRTEAHTTRSTGGEAKVSHTVGDAKIDLTTLAAWEVPLRLPPAASDAQMRAYYRVILHTLPINYDLIEFGIEFHMPPLVHMVGIRQPVYEMGTAIYMRGFGEAGLTFMGENNVMMQAGAQRKTFIIHFSCYAKPVLFEAQLVHHNENIICREYYGGNGTTFWDPLDPEQLSTYKQGDPVPDRDIIMMMLGPGEEITSRWFDITGRLDPSMCANDESDPLCYSTADIYSAVWGWVPHAAGAERENNALFPPLFDPDPAASACTLVFRDHQWVFGVSSHRDERSSILGRVVTAQGHWGPNIYPGVGITRKSAVNEYIREMNYGCK